MNIDPPRFTDPHRLDKLATAFPRIDALFARLREQRRLPGVVYGVVVDGELVHGGGIGLRNIEEEAPVAPDTIFRIASMSKSITAMCVLRLRDAGKLSLAAPVAEYVPEFAALRYPTKDSAPITVQQLLTMSGGLPQDDPWADRQLAIHEEQLSEWLRGGVSFSNPPGITFEYSNYGYAILGRVVTNVAGTRLQDYATKHIFDPLGMTSTGWDRRQFPPERIAQGYRLDGTGWQADPMLSDGAFASIGGVFTTVPDWAAYMSYLMDAFPPRDDAETGPVSRSTRRELQQGMRFRGMSTVRRTPSSSLFASVMGYGYGLIVEQDSILKTSVWHSGGLPGFGSCYRMVPESGVGVVAFSNLRYGGLVDGVHEALVCLSETGGLSPRTVQVSVPLTRARDAITRIYNTWNDAELDALVADNFFLDFTVEQRRATFEKLRFDFGEVQSVSEIRAENALRGWWALHCERGSIEVFATLSPAIPPLLQYLVLIPIKPLSPAMTLAARRLIRMIDQWDDLQFRTLFGRTFRWEETREQLEAVHIHYGRLMLGPTLEGDGETRARIRLDGAKGAIDATLTLDPKTGKLRDLTFTRPRDTAIVQ